MEKKKLYFLIGFLLSFVFITASYYVVGRKKVVNYSNPLHIDFSSLKSVRFIYSDWLEHEENQIWKEIEQKIKLTKQECQNLKKTWSEDYKKGEKALYIKDAQKNVISQKTYDKVESILSDFNLSSKELSIVPWNENSAAAATDFSLFINEKEFEKLSFVAQKFVIAHEIQHFIHKDNSTNYVLERLTQSTKNPHGQSHPLNKLSRFHELRADIKAALGGNDYAKGYVSFMEVLSKNLKTKG